MKNIFDKNAREELVTRISHLKEDATAQWGKMNLFQMLRHCSMWDEWILGNDKYVYKQAFIGFIFGKIALRRMIKDEKPFDKNVPTSPELKVKETTGDIAAEKQKWMELIRAYEQYSNPGFIHDFFGKMTREQVGILAYKHTDHHLRQFNG